MLAATAGSLALGGTAARTANKLTYAPIVEVAIFFGCMRYSCLILLPLFAGITRVVF